MSAQISYAPQRPSSAAGMGPADRGFFAYHGFWAPGVRLFRRLRFTSKALIISLAFLLPLLGLLAYQIDSHAQQAMAANRQTATIAKAFRMENSPCLNSNGVELPLPWSRRGLVQQLLGELAKQIEDFPALRRGLKPAVGIGKLHGPMPEPGENDGQRQAGNDQRAAGV